MQLGQQGFEVAVHARGLSEGRAVGGRRDFAQLRAILVRVRPAAGQTSGNRTRPDSGCATVGAAEMSFHLIALQLGDEPEMLDRAVEALEEVEPGETVF